MSKIDFLKEQIIEARTFVNRLMSELPEDLWYVIPEGTDSNFIWQVGHLLVSQNFHTLTAVTGVNERVGKWVPIQKYNSLAECLQPLPFKHPVAEIKYEALSWSFKHEMWHSAEMEAIKRDLGYPIVWMK